ncbi:MAG: hypothetical protein LBB77_03890 [Treponema sp.]|jgi:hypothetical protein|nr:hypothetical protein [Treponema sp.]
MKVPPSTRTMLGGVGRSGGAAGCTGAGAGCTATAGMVPSQAVSKN